MEKGGARKEKASSLFQGYSVNGLAEWGLGHCKSSIKVPFILYFISKALFSIQCFIWLFFFLRMYKSHCFWQTLLPLVWFPSRFTDQSFRLIALVKSDKSSSTCWYSWQSDWQWNCSFMGVPCCRKNKTSVPEEHQA